MDAQASPRQINELPMPFVASMVRPIMSGKKTKTRRIAKFEQGAATIPFSRGTSTQEYKEGWVIQGRIGACWNDLTEPLPCPYGKVGDFLWVQEPHDFDPGGVVRDAAGGVMDSFEPEPIFEADGGQPSGLLGRWMQPKELERKYSRIKLQIVSIGLEKLRDITEEECAAEGIYCETSGDTMEGDYEERFLNYLKPTSVVDDDGEQIEITNFLSDPIESFKSLWESIEGEGAWELNPWVWVIEFKRVDA